MIPTREDWCTPDKIMDPNVDIWLPDSSRINNGFVANVYGPMDNHREIIPMGSLAAVFQAQVMAILRCTELFLSKNENRRRMHFSSGGRAVITAFAKTKHSVSFCMGVYVSARKTKWI